MKAITSINKLTNDINKQAASNTFQLTIYRLPDGSEWEVSCVELSGEEIHYLAADSVFTYAVARYIAINNIKVKPV